MPSSLTVSLCVAQPAGRPYELSFDAVPDRGALPPQVLRVRVRVRVRVNVPRGALPPQVLRARREKEAASLQAVEGVERALCPV